MPIYEYKSISNGCNYCMKGFEVIQKIHDDPLTKCPKCQTPVIKLVSSFHACVIETPEDVIRTEKAIREYENEGRWSHAAELADKAGLEEHAREDYKKAGYDI